MAQTAWQDGRVPWGCRALSAVAVMTLAVAGTRTTIAAASGGAGNGRMACGDAPRPPVRLHLIDRAGLSFDTRNELMRETLVPWGAVGAVLEWAESIPTRPAGLGEPEDLYVLVKADAVETAEEHHLPMASILFVDGLPTTHITVHAGHVARLLADVRLDDVPFAKRPRLIRERVLGRVLGRVVAHEVGHFLLASREHAPAGLMRASHRLEHLLAPAHATFRVRLPAIPPCSVARTLR